MENITGYSLLVRNLRYSTTSQIVREVFEKFGKIRDVYLPLDYNTRRPRGFGFIEFYDKGDVQEAVKAMDNAELDGSIISCCLAQDRRKSPNSMRRVYGNSFRNRRDTRGYDRRYRSRSRSYDRHRSYSPRRRIVNDRDERGYYRRSLGRSPGYYSRDYRQPFRDRAPIRDRRDYRDRGGRNYDRLPRDRRYYDRQPSRDDDIRRPTRSRSRSDLPSVDNEIDMNNTNHE